MLPVVIGGAILAVGVLAWLSAGENKARQSFERSQTKLNNAIQEMNHEIHHARKRANDSKNFECHIALYHASVAQSKSHYADYEVYKELVATVKAKKEDFGRQIGKFKRLVQLARGENKRLYRDELAKYYTWHNEAKTELGRLYAKKDELLAQVRQINRNTHAIKCILRDKCGRGGRVWYERKFGDD